MRTTLTESMAVVDDIGNDIKPRIVANNTFRYSRQDGTVVYRLHFTDIMEDNGGYITLNTGGWFTQTTKERMNEFLSGYSIIQEKGQWYVIANGKGQSVPFYDGMRLPDAFHGEAKEKAENQAKENEKLKKEIDRFVKAVIKPGESIPQPSAGDCFYCMGMDQGNNTEHLHSHMEENYLPGMMFVNACRQNGMNDTGISILFYNDYRAPDHNQARRVLRQYLKYRFGLPS